MRETPAAAAAAANARAASSVESAEVAPGRHRVHQVVRNVDALERRRQRGRVQRIGLHQLDPLPFARLEHLDVARRRANPRPARNSRGTRFVPT